LYSIFYAKIIKTLRYSVSLKKFLLEINEVVILPYIFLTTKKYTGKIFNDILNEDIFFYSYADVITECIK
jgi:hypothetical protein